jgi:hypothetical protein
VKLARPTRIHAQCFQFASRPEVITAMLRRIVLVAARQSNASSESWQQRLLPRAEHLQQLKNVAMSATAGPNQSAENAEASSAQSRADSMDSSDSDDAPEAGTATGLNAADLKVRVVSHSARALPTFVSVHVASSASTGEDRSAL